MAEPLVIEKRWATPMHEIKGDKLQQGQNRAPSKRYKAFLREIEERYLQCMLCEEVVENLDPREEISERKVHDH